jgi:DNA-binding transcriptional MerR regulator
MISAGSGSEMRAPGYYTIGEFAKLSGISPKALRFYDKVGLFRPAAVDSRTGYRRYSPHQLQDLATIRMLKELGASLSDIRRALGKQASARSRRPLLEKLKSVTQETLNQAQQSLALIDLMLSDIDRNEPSIPFVIKRRPPFAVASIRAEVNSYNDILSYEHELLKVVPAELTINLRGVLWHRCSNCGPVEGEPFVALKHELPAKGFRVNHLPPVTVVSSYSGLDDAEALATYDAISHWIHLRGYSITGPRREIYLGDMLEIQFPIS